MDIYKTPLTERYTSSEMQKLFSLNTRHITWRKLWIALARAQKELGLDITDEQIQELEKQRDHLNFDVALEYERTFKHDVMAHLHAYGDLCPKAMPILHLGATSCFVTDNADLMILKEGLCFVLAKLCSVIETLSKRSMEYKELPCLSYTHFQAAQPTTMGKRIAMWLQDFVWDAERLVDLIEKLPFLGAKGTTGTQASFVQLFGDEKLVERLDALIAKECGFEGKALIVSGQTYPRKLDAFILETFSGIAVTAHKFGNDLRLLSHTKELYEKFVKGQVGSSAMPYKKNPIHSERLCSLSRFVQSLGMNGQMTASTQWLERSLDDSANRRIVLPEAFLGVDALLNLSLSLSENFIANEEVIQSLLDREMAHMVTENILMECVKRGGNRQTLHDKLKNISHSNTESSLSFVLDAVEADEAFPIDRSSLELVTQSSSLTGRAKEQVILFQNQVVTPLLQRAKKHNSTSFSSTEIL